jgi:hypothetical protein
MTNKLPGHFLAQIAEVVQRESFGVAKAVKRGRNSRFPYVPV